MEEKVCFDTSVCIEIVKNRIDKPLERVMNSSAFLSSVTVFELMLRTYNIDAMRLFISTFEILAFDEVAARKASELEKMLSKEGNIISREDIFIAATAMVNNCALATLNAKDFSKINGLKLVRLR